LQGGNDSSGNETADLRCFLLCSNDSEEQDDAKWEHEEERKDGDENEKEGDADEGTDGTKI